VRIIWLIPLAMLLLALESALFRVFFVEAWRPDCILLLVVFLAFRSGTLAGIVVFVMGFMADSFAGTTHGMLTSVYLMIWAVVRVMLVFFIPDRRTVQFGLLVAMSLLANLLEALLLSMTDVGPEPVSRLMTLMAPMVVLHVILAIPVWALAERLAIGRQPRHGLIGLG
jgi:rod shape-determining protein MreD